MSPQIPETLYMQAFKTKIPQRGRKLIEGFKNCGNQPISGYGMRQAYDAWYNTIMTTNSTLRKAGVPLQIVKVKAAEYFPENEYRLFTVEKPKDGQIQQKKSRKPAKSDTTKARDLESELTLEGSFGVESQKAHRLRMGF